MNNAPHTPEGGGIHHATPLPYIFPPHGTSFDEAVKHWEERCAQLGQPVQPITTFASTSERRSLSMRTGRGPRDRDRDRDRDRGHGRERSDWGPHRGPNVTSSRHLSPLGGDMGSGQGSDVMTGSDFDRLSGAGSSVPRIGIPGYARDRRQSRAYSSRSRRRSNRVGGYNSMSSDNNNAKEILQAAATAKKKTDAPLPPGSNWLSLSFSEMTWFDTRWRKTMTNLPPSTILSRWQKFLGRSVLDMCFGPPLMAIQTTRRLLNVMMLRVVLDAVLLGLSTAQSADIVDASCTLTSIIIITIYMSINIALVANLLMRPTFDDPARRIHSYGCMLASTLLAAFLINRAAYFDFKSDPFPVAQVRLRWSAMGAVEMMSGIFINVGYHINVAYEMATVVAPIIALFTLTYIQLSDMGEVNAVHQGECKWINGVGVVGATLSYFLWAYATNGGPLFSVTRSPGAGPSSGFIEDGWVDGQRKRGRGVGTWVLHSLYVTVCIVWALTFFLMLNLINTIALSPVIPFDGSDAGDFARTYSLLLICGLTTVARMLTQVREHVFHEVGVSYLPHVNLRELLRLWVYNQFIINLKTKPKKKSPTRQNQKNAKGRGGLGPSNTHPSGKDPHDGAGDHDDSDPPDGSTPRSGKKPFTPDQASSSVTQSVEDGGSKGTPRSNEGHLDEDGSSDAKDGVRRPKSAHVARGTLIPPPGVVEKTKTRRDRKERDLRRRARTAGSVEFDHHGVPTGPGGVGTVDALGPSERVPGSSRILMKTTQEPTICTMIEVPRLHEMLATFPHQKVNEIRTNLDNTIYAVMSRMNPESRRHDMGGYGGRFLFLTEICADEKIGKETKEKRKGTHAHRDATKAAAESSSEPLDPVVVGFRLAACLAGAITATLVNVQMVEAEVSGERRGSSDARSTARDDSGSSDLTPGSPFPGGPTPGGLPMMQEDGLVESLISTPRPGVEILVAFTVAPTTKFTYTEGPPSYVGCMDMAYALLRATPPGTMGVDGHTLTLLGPSHALFFNQPSSIHVLGRSCRMASAMLDVLVRMPWQDPRMMLPPGTISFGARAGDESDETQEEMEMIIEVSSDENAEETLRDLDRYH